MKQDEIIEMAKTVGIKYKPVLQEFHSEFRNGVALEDIEEFSKLVAAKEREACAKVVDDWSDWHGGTEIIAAAIRARGQA